jgi:hypothetical protein
MTNSKNEPQIYFKTRCGEVKAEITELYKVGQGLVTNWDTNSPEWRRYSQEAAPILRRIHDELDNLNLALQERLSEEKESSKTLERGLK